MDPNSGNSLAGNLTIILILLLSQTSSEAEATIKTEVFFSPEIVLDPGSVSNKYYYDVAFPRGHIAIKSFNAEVVDAAGDPVPLHETYLHHWVILRYFYPRLNESDYTIIRNSGPCASALSQYFGLGSETRRTATDVPDPYGIEVGDPARVPPGHEEGWMLNVHAIDTRGAHDRMGCTECRCDLYGATVDEDGKVLPPDYRGGLRCCGDGMRCSVREGYWGVRRRLYLRYTVKYVDWDPAFIVPVKIYILDVTDDWSRGTRRRGSDVDMIVR